MSDNKSPGGLTERELLEIQIRKAIVAQCDRWDAELAIEKLLGVEIDTEDYIKEAACEINDPHTDDLDGYVHDLAEIFVAEAAEIKAHE